MKKCPKCGAELQSDSFFCNYCGAPWHDVKAEPQIQSQTNQTGFNGLSLKKAFIIAGATVLVLGVIIGVAETIAGKNKIYDESKNVPSATIAAKTKNQESEKREEQKEEDPAETDKNIVVYDNNGIKLTYKGFKNDIMPELTFFLENSSDKTYMVSSDDVSINDYMISTTILEEVAPGKKVNTSMVMFSSALEDNNITKIEKVEFKLHCTNSDDYTDSFDSDVITITDP